jgi:RNA polymerase sigma-70 factor (ECF subfamily)
MSDASAQVDDPFVAHRGLLFTVAYEMLGEAADAEDVVQETWLRWAGLADDERDAVNNPRAYLVRIVTRQALNRLRTLARRREDYIGEWLPEPLLTTPDIADDVALADSVSLAMLTVLETLTPTERAVFVLREVFDVSYDEIAQAIDKSSAAVRQIAHRSREHVAARRPRVEVDRREQLRVMDRFLAAVRTGDIQGLIDVMAPDVVLVSDGGGFKKAALRPIYGVDKVLRWLAGVVPTDGQVSGEHLWINGEPGIRFDLEGELDTVVTAEVVGGTVTRIFAVRNPHKLARLGEPTVLRR